MVANSFVTKTCFVMWKTGQNQIITLYKALIQLKLAKNMEYWKLAHFWERVVEITSVLFAAWIELLHQLRVLHRLINNKHVNNLYDLIKHYPMHLKNLIEMFKC